MKKDEATKVNFLIQPVHSTALEAMRQAEGMATTAEAIRKLIHEGLIAHGYLTVEKA